MKKKFILITLIIVLLFIEIFIFYNFIFIRYKNKTSIENIDIKIAEELKNSPFKVEKIILYSSASAENKNTNFQSTNWILDIFQYTDMAIYISSTEAIKALSVSNISLNNPSQKLYYLDANEFGTGKIFKNFEIQDSLEFSILNFDNSDNSIGYNTPVFFADASNPITLKFTNTVFENYSIKNTEKIAFNGSILAQTPVKLDNLSNTISFNINIKDYNNNQYTTTLNIDIPLQNDISSILDGSCYSEQTNLNIPLLIEKKIDEI